MVCRSERIDILYIQAYSAEQFGTRYELLRTKLWCRCTTAPAAVFIDGSVNDLLLPLMTNNEACGPFLLYLRCANGYTG